MLTRTEWRVDGCAVGLLFGGFRGALVCPAYLEQSSLEKSHPHKKAKTEQKRTESMHIIYSTQLKSKVVNRRVIAFKSSRR
jgi:hypothetical protein